MPQLSAFKWSTRSQLVTVIGSRPVISLLPAFSRAHKPYTTTVKHSKRSIKASRCWQTNGFGELYIAALVAAGSCHTSHRRTNGLRYRSSLHYQSSGKITFTQVRECAPQGVYMARSTTRAQSLGGSPSRSWVPYRCYSSKSRTLEGNEKQTSGRKEAKTVVNKEAQEVEQKRPEPKSLLDKHKDDFSMKSIFSQETGQRIKEIKKQLELLATIRDLEGKLDEARDKLRTFSADTVPPPKEGLENTLREAKQELNVSSKNPSTTLAPPDVRIAKADITAHLSTPRDRAEDADNASGELSTLAPDTSVTTPGQRGLTKQDILDLVDIYYYSPPEYIAPFSTYSPNPVVSDYGLVASNSASTMHVNSENETFARTNIASIHEQLLSSKKSEFHKMEHFLDLLLDENASTHDLFSAYQTFPTPGVKYLSWSAIRLLLQRMSVPTYKGQKSMLRYLSLIEDMQQASLPITSAEWTSAIYLAARSFTKVTEKEFSSALKMWKRMEEEAGVKPSHVTFNVLFDISVRAQKFVVAEMILKEIHKRELNLNRLGRVTLIGYFGARGNGDGVRKAYRDFVEAGEIVDTLVLTAVIKALCAAGEPAAAEQVYERMKALNIRLGEEATEAADQDPEDMAWLKYPPPGPRTFGNDLASNSLGRILTPAWKLQRKGFPSNHAQLQNAMPLKPNIRTYLVLLEYHVLHSGDLDRITVLLDDMLRVFGIALHDKVFKWLFQGFAIYGGSRYTNWTTSKLESVWASFLRGARTTTRIHRFKQTGQRFRSADVEALDQIWSQYDPIDALPSGQVRGRERRSLWGRFSKAIGERASADLLRAVQLPAADDEDTNDMHLTDENFTIREKDRVLATDNDPEPNVMYRKWLVIWALRAFGRCCGRSRTEEVWFELTRLWQPANETDMDVAKAVLRSALRATDRKAKQ